ncbi:type I secretion system permease/ATPase [Aquipseudomonas guryensis]|jgi:ATP-binding cassette subfamily C exporter for protease/lipase|uniref:Type I secretion system permease/ATPase n=1 Tax=Aquipseudomonas guryensis TaxID=2759165 RepID=A0A7W4DAZ2_9GAMM|nr:type I secretion system permease/ATPase [Pseudomonas guryensis]MBB1518962.1 type I secretion system permease/ATPase [Pseudomonas guryensis]
MRLRLDPTRDIDAALLRYRSLFWVIALFSGVINLLTIVPAIYMMQVFDRVMASRNETTLLLLTILALGLFLLSSLVEWIRGQVMIKMSAGIDLDLGERLFGVAFQKSLKEHNANPAQVLSDLNALRQFLTGSALISLLDLPWMPIFLIVTGLLHPWLGLFTLLGALILFALAIWNEHATRKGLDEANQISVHSAKYVNSTLQNAEVIQAMGMLSNLQKRWAAMQQRLIGAQSTASDKAAGISTITRLVRTAWQSLAMGLAMLLILDGQISGGVMMAAGFLISKAMLPAEQAISSWKQLDNAKASYKRLCDLLEEFPRKLERMSLPEPTGAIRIERLVVTPPGSKRPAVNGIDLALAKGEVLAIIGPSASGKSSLARAMVGVWPPSYGSVRLDGAEIGQWASEALGPHLGYLPQDIELFDGTVAENIARFGETDSSKIIEAATLAGIHQMVLRFPQGYDTLLGPGGLGLSGGQKQRIGLARALYGKPALVVLDEPNSNLDDAGEAALVAAIDALRKHGSTVVLVTHRPNVLAVVDKLLVLQEGTQKMFGPRDQVLKALFPSNAPASTDPSTQTS